MKVAGWDVNKIRDSVLGKEFETNNCGKCVVVDYKGRNDVFVKFYNPEYTVKCRMSLLKLGNVSNPMHPTLYGVGYIGVGKHSSKTNERIYKVWGSILQRCYSEVYHQTKTEKYKGVSVCEAWKDLQNFATWWEGNKFSNLTDDKGNSYQIDKDLLSFGDKKYCPETCCFVPSEINSLILDSRKSRGDYPIGVVPHIQTGKFMSRLSKGKLSSYLGLYNTPEEAFSAYKVAKEAHVKEVAVKWKGKIDDRVYQSLMTWEISIGD